MPNTDRGEPRLNGRLVLDWRGRAYLVGVPAEQILGRSRSSVLWAAWAAMAAIGVLQYGVGAALAAVGAAQGRPHAHMLWLLAGWTVCQAAIGLPTAAMLERRGLGARVTMPAGALLACAGPIALAHAGDQLWAFAGYSVLSGVGGGLVYATCSSVVARWYPERSAARVSLVTGAFAYGAAPFALAVHVLGASAPAGGAGLTVALDGTAVAILAIVAVTGRLLREPPEHWWPGHIDPREWALDGRVNPGLRTNPRAVREFSSGEALRTPVLLALAAILVFAGAVSLFNVIVAAGMGARHGVVPAIVAATALIALNGAGRSVSVAVSEKTGRRAALAGVLALLTAGQVALAGAAATGSGVLTAAFVMLAGLGGGGFYPLIACLAREYFGDRRTGEIHGIIYATKGAGGVIAVGIAVISPSASAALGAALLALLTMIFALCLRQPGRPRTLPLPAPIRTV